jgi:hypothetical protein
VVVGITLEEAAQRARRIVEAMQGRQDAEVILTHEILALAVELNLRMDRKMRAHYSSKPPCADSPQCQLARISSAEVGLR